MDIFELTNLICDEIVFSGTLERLLSPSEQIWSVLTRIELLIC